MQNNLKKDIIITELRENLNVLIDPKKKDSFSDNRVNTWIKLVSERLIYHLDNLDKNKKNG
jgi:hypothetical protein